MKDYKMVVMDLDDTLLQEDLSISNETKNILEKCQKDGITVVLASGRPTYAIERYAKELKLDEYGGYIVAFNGAIVKDCKKNEIVMQRDLPSKYLEEILSLSKEHKVYIHTYVGNNIITPLNNEYTKVEEKLTGMKVIEVENFLEAIDQEVVKVLLLEEPSYLKTVKEKLDVVLGNKLSLTISKPFFLEIMDKDMEKSYSLNYLCNLLNIKSSQVISFGDSYNDMSMIKFAGLGIAMGNAQEAVKEIADYITAGNNEDGIPKAINKFVYEKVLTNV